MTNDILQEVFLKIHLNLTKLKDQSKLSSWIYQITRNTINDYFRKHKPQADLDELNLENPDNIFVCGRSNSYVKC